jgi:FkbM family methyltransferase
MTTDDLLDKCLEISDGVTGVLHVGAHIGQEAPTYAKHGIENVTWIEANPALKERLEANVLPLGHRVFIEAIGDRFLPAAPLHLADNDGHSSSLLNMDEHLNVWPDVKCHDSCHVVVYTLASVHRRYNLTHHNFWVLDVQGMEACAIRGAGAALALADYILCEVSHFPLYEGGATLDQIDDLLRDFTAVYARISDRTHGIGNMFYRRIRRSGRDLVATA